jgi:hypothetical protein
MRLSSMLSLILCLATFGISEAYAAREDMEFPDTLELKKDKYLGNEPLTYSGRMFNKISDGNYIECQLSLVSFNKVLMQEKPAKYLVGGTWETEFKNGAVQGHATSIWEGNTLTGEAKESTYIRRDSQGAVGSRLNVKCGQVVFQDANVHATIIKQEAMPKSFKKFYLGSGSKLIPAKYGTNKAGRSAAGTN